MNLKEAIVYSEGSIVSKVIFGGESTHVTLFSMATGTNIEEHTSSKEGYVYVIEGKGIFTLGEAIPLVPETIISMKKGEKHSITAEENTSFLLFLTS